MKHATLLLTVLAVLPASSRGQGELDPPPGPPAPGMKTLAQVEPRTDVLGLAGDANYHHIIAARGSYYLSGNLDVSLAHGIDIRAEAITLDLGGFAVRRTAGSGGNGVELSPNLNGIAVRNGSISGFARGLSLFSNSACRFTRLNLSGGTAGIGLTQDCKANLILDCAITGTSGDGILLQTGTGGGPGGSCNQNLIQRCIVTKTGGSGIEFDAGQTGNLLGNAVLDSTVLQTGTNQDGIRISGGNAQMNGNIISKCTIAQTGGSGVELSASSAFADGNILSDLTVRRAVEHGVHLVSGSNGNLRGNLVQRVVVSDPNGMNISLEAIQGGDVSGNVVRECVGRDSGVVGMECDGGVSGESNFNRIENNHFSRTPPFLVIGSHHAISTSSSRGNLILRNSASGFVHGYSIGSSDTAGPTVTTAGQLNASGNNDHPWANFSR